MHRYFEQHRAMLDGALKAAAQRTYWSAAPEAPSGKIYGETAKADAEAAFKAQLGKPFDIDHPGSQAPRQGGEPVGLSARHHLSRLRPSTSSWRRRVRQAPPGRPPASRRASAYASRSSHRLNKQSFAIANAVQHTSGQPFVMAFQAGGPHAQDRALEAVAYAYCGNDQGAGARRAGRSRRAAGRSRCAWTSSGASCRAASP